MYLLQKNVGPLDRAIRLSVGIVLLPAGLFWAEGALGLVLVGIGLIGLVTGATGRCPTYALLGVNTLSARVDLARAPEWLFRIGGGMLVAAGVVILLETPVFRYEAPGSFVILPYATTDAVALVILYVGIRAITAARAGA